MNPTPLLELLSHTAIKGAAVLLLALLAGLALYQIAAARRYAVWLTAVAALAVLPLAMALLPAWHVLPKTTTEMDWPVPEPEMPLEAPVRSVNLVEQKPQSTAPSSVSVPAAPPKAPAFVFSQEKLFQCLPVVWISIASLLLLRLAWSAWCLRRLERQLQPAHCAALAGIAQEIGLSRVPILFVGDANAVPMVWGVWSPRLLLPQGFETWSREKQRGVLLHELSHLKRRDPLALWTAQWVKALHWFNPLVWLTLRQLRADQERACDDAVLRHGVRPSDYAQSLLDLSRHTRLAPGLSLCALTITRCAPVEARVKAILDPTRRREGLTLRWLATLAGGALLITLPVAMLHAIEGPTLRGRILDRNGVVLAESTKEKVRQYPLKTLAAHTLGYVRRSDSDGSVQEGHAAIEKQQNDTLKAGRDVTLTLDARIQALTLRAMKDGGVTRGAVVVLDPRTGEILASASLPSYDPNVFVPSVSFGDWARYLRDKNVPLMDRSQKGFYQPDAALTPLTGLAAICAGVGDQSFACQSPVKQSQAVYSCWRLREGKAGHGLLSIDTAMEQGCWYYWFQLGMSAGFPKLGEVGTQLGFGSTYGLVEETHEGVWPTQEWWEKHRSGQRAWLESNTADLAMGQGYVKATPMQMAVLAATMANSGMAPQPHFIRGPGVSKLADFHFEGTQAAQMQKLREGMRLVVNGNAGTGQSARSDKVMIAGKNAMVQRWHRINQNPELTHSWFIGFAPFDRPTLAFAILKQGSKSEDDDATPIARRIVEETLALPADGSGEVLPVEENLSELQLVQAQFDAKADVLRAAIERLKPEETTGFPLDEIRVRNGQILIRGAALGMIQALQFRDKVRAIEWEDPLEWNFPVPQTLTDGKRVGFVMLGTLLWEGKTTTSLEDVQASLVILNDPRVYGWEDLLKAAGLAELPGGTEARHGEAGDPSVNFYLLRQNVAGWLRASLGAEVDVGWLETNTGKIQHYPAKNGYKVEVLPMRSPNLFKVTVTPPGKTAAATKPADQAQLRQQSDADIRMKPALAKHWAALKRAGLLADLPASARPFDLGDNHPERQMKSVSEIHFWTSRVDVRRWLLDSHCSPAKAEPLASRLSLLWEPPAAEDIAADWPAPPEPFRRTYAAAGHCEVDIRTSDGENVIVTVRQIRPSILIAPDESQEPRPAGKLAPEYPGKSLTQDEAMPGLDVALQTLRPTISPLEVRLPAFRPHPVQLSWQAPAPPSVPILEEPFPLNRLQGDLSPESVKALQRSLRSGSRMQQALVVKAPL
ncbi:MAG: hypothetical protein K9N47_04200 [Prosthecobacter sp.]|uniref:M56 family metallopeptidase n=1 Tax=Prosthecobacter sp. TaxID=1965333 RepID=UPI0025E22F4E|nr:M56 family metallopeptidase [Prosthecobacter sp.]MCF7785297.1 hypothetical protein [Prosthecobacter sp.]